MDGSALDLVNVDELLREAGVSVPDFLSPTSVLFKLITHGLSRKEHKFSQLQREMFEDWIVAAHRAVREQVLWVREHEHRISELEALAMDPQFERVLGNYQFEASREAMDERRRMLALAYAGSLHPGMTVAQLARVERVIRELDPEDVKVLAAVRRINAPPLNEERVFEDGEQALHDERIQLLKESGASGAALVASACVAINDPVSTWAMQSSCVITPIGEWVLAVMGAYLRVVDGPL